MKSIITLLFIWVGLYICGCVAAGTPNLPAWEKSTREMICGLMVIGLVFVVLLKPIVNYTMKP